MPARRRLAATHAPYVRAQLLTMCAWASSRRRLPMLWRVNPLAQPCKHKKPREAWPRLTPEVLGITRLDTLHKVIPTEFRQREAHEAPDQPAKLSARSWRMRPRPADATRRSHAWRMPPSRRELSPTSSGAEGPRTLASASATTGCCVRSGGPPARCQRGEICAGDHMVSLGLTLAAFLNKRLWARKSDSLAMGTDEAPRQHGHPALDTKR